VPFDEAKNHALAYATRVLDRIGGRRQHGISTDDQPMSAADSPLELKLAELDRKFTRLQQATDCQNQTLHDVERRLTDVQALTARVYEHLQDWPAQLRQIRETADYSRAWDDANPLVSVRIATYQDPDLLCDRALRSVQRQTHENWECIVVGDADSEITAERVRAIGDPRISFLNLPFRGPYPDDPASRWRVAGIPAMNRGTQEANGLWIAPLDHDDEWDDDHIDVLLNHARTSGAELVYGKLRVRDAASRRLVNNVVGAWPPVEGQFGLQGAFYHASLRAFEMDLNARFAGEPGDWNLTRRMWEAGVKFAFLDRAVTTYYWTPKDADGRAWLEANFLE
jgi:glycosyl transferase family 2